MKDPLLFKEKLQLILKPGSVSNKKRRIVAEIAKKVKYRQNVHCQDTDVHLVKRLIALRALPYCQPSIVKCLKGKITLNYTKHCPLSSCTARAQIHLEDVLAT